MYAKGTHNFSGLTRADMTKATKNPQLLGSVLWHQVIADALLVAVHNQDVVAKVGASVTRAVVVAVLWVSTVETEYTDNSIVVGRNPGTFQRIG